MKKKVMAALLAATMTIGLLAGCGAKGNEKGTSVKQESSTASEQESQKEESKYPEYLNLESARPIVKEGEEITLKIATQRASVAETPVEDLWFLKFVEEKLNINLEIEWLTTENKDERLSLMLAGDDLPDILMGISLTTDQITKYAMEEEMFLPLSDYASEELTPNMLVLWDRYEDYMYYYTTPNSKIYTVPSVLPGIGVSGYADTVPVYKTYIDTRYMDAAGITEMPTTLDGFVDMLRAFKAIDPAVLGVKEFWPMLKGVSSTEQAYFTQAFGWMLTDYTDLTAPCWDMEKNEVVIPCLEDKYADYLTFFNMLYAEELIHPDFYTLDKASIRAIAAAGQAGVVHDWAPYLFNGEGEMYKYYPTALPLSSEYNEKGVALGGSALSEGTIYVSASTEYPELCMRFIDYLCSPEGLVYFALGCPEGSEDTFGMITGYTLGDTYASYSYAEVDAGKYGSTFDYINNAISLTQGTAVSAEAYSYYMYEIAGVAEEQIPPMGLDETNRADWFSMNQASAVDGCRVQQLPQLYINSENSERYVDLKTVLKNYVESESAKFIIGQRPLSELPDFINELKQMGGEEYSEIVLSNYKDYEGPSMY